jgi:hypothetical protein
MNKNELFGPLVIEFYEKSGTKYFLQYACEKSFGKLKNILSMKDWNSARKEKTHMNLQIISI